MKKKEDPKEPEAKKEEGWKPNWDLSKDEPKLRSSWAMTYTSDAGLDPIERLISELRGTNRTMYAHRSVLFVLLMLSMIAHAVR